MLRDYIDNSNYVNLRGKTNLDFQSIFEDRRFWCFGGCYELRNDTICLDEYSLHPYWWDVVKLHFKIISEDSIELVRKTIINTDWISKVDYHEHYVFVLAKTLPVSDNVRIKKKKWIWRDEKDWKAWKERHKRKTKRKK